MGLLATIKSLFGISSSADRHLVCEDCKKKFVFDSGEQKFFKAKGFSDPKRCPRCRKKVKTRIPRRGSGGGRNGRSHQRHRGRSRRHSLIEGDSPYADE